MQVLWRIGALAICALIAAGCGGGGDDGDTTLRHDIALLGKAEPPRSPTGPRSVIVPDVRGERIAVATRDLRARGLLIHGRFPGTIGNPNHPTHCVIVSNQAPRGGTHVRHGSSVVAVLGICEKAMRS